MSPSKAFVPLQLQMDDEMGDSVSRCWEKDDKTIYLSIS